MEDPISRRHELEARATWLAEQAERERRQLEVESEREQARQQAELAHEQHVTEVEIVRAQREAYTAHAVDAAKKGTAFALPATPHLPSASNVEPSVEPVATPNSAKPTKAQTVGNDLDALVEFVSARTAAGENTSGSDLANEFGFSDKTGRRRLNALRDSHPEIFIGEINE